LSHFATLSVDIDWLCKLLKLKTFIYQKSLDTSVFRLIRFCQKVLAEFAFRWNYSPLKEKAAHVAGWPFCFGSFCSAIDPGVFDFVFSTLGEWIKSVEDDAAVRCPVASVE